jgi:16S rRNA (guanine527-N7)-methyltransferase
LSSEYPEPPASAPTAPPASAIELFGAALPRAVRYAGLLADAGVQRGLIGPREVGRLWERHLVNCAVVAEEIPADALVVDVGSGAGLPGIVIALARPDVQVALLEPLLRRTVFLEEMVGELGLDNVTVVRGRAEEWAGRMDAEVVTARAVAPLERLVGWCLPLLGPKGRMLALKGETATAELAAIRGTLPALGVVKADVVEVGARFGEAATRVVRIDLGARGYLSAQSSVKRSNSKQTKLKQVKAPQPKPRRQIHGD